MSKNVIQRIAQGLDDRRKTLSAWLGAERPETKAIRLGSHPEQEVHQHLSVVDQALQQAESGVLGTCTVCHEQIETHWLETNYTNCVCLEHLTGEDRSRLESELELSQKVQQALLPHSTPVIPGWEIAAFSQPASIVSGDFFDFLRFRGGEEALLIADVMGKGVPASMLMASLQASLRIIVPESEVPDRALYRANDLFYHNIRLTKFVSIVLVQIRPNDGVISYANAGHHPPFLVRGRDSGNGRIVSLRPTGAAIGLVEKAAFETASMHAAAGDSLVLYTDGVVEARNPSGEEFGEKRLGEYLLAQSGNHAGAIVRGLRDEIHLFAGGKPLSDDATIVVCKRTS